MKLHITDMVVSVLVTVGMVLLADRMAPDPDSAVEYTVTALFGSFFGLVFTLIGSFRPHDVAVRYYGVVLLVLLGAAGLLLMDIHLGLIGLTLPYALPLVLPVFLIRCAAWYWTTRRRPRADR